MRLFVVSDGVSYGIVGKPGAYSSLTPVLDLVHYVSLCQGLRAESDFLHYNCTRQL